MMYQDFTVTEYHPDLPKEANIGRMLLDQGKISAGDAERVLLMQRETGMLFGEAALRMGLITPIDIEQILAEQFRYSYLQPGEGGFSEELVAAYQPFSDTVEALRALRSQLMLRWFGAGRKSLAVFGVDCDDGVSVLAANLAIVFSQLGKRTLLVDANLRTPHQHVLFNLDTRAGLSDILATRADIDVACRITSFHSLSILTAGTRAPNPQELLGRRRFSSLSVDACVSHDVILYEAPALHRAMDALAVAAMTGGVLLVGHKNTTSLAAIRAASTKIKSCGAVLVGTIMMQGD